MSLVGLVHSTRLVIEPVHQVIFSQCPDLDLIHIMDEGILRALKKEGRITEKIIDWLTGMIRPIEEEGGKLAVVTCSSLSPCVNAVRERVKIPVLKIDEPMIEWAVKSAENIGLVMTNPTTEQPSKLLITEISQRFEKRVNVISRLNSEAFWKLNAGDIQGHDDEVIRTVHDLLADVELVILAQISIARVLQQLDESLAPKVLSSLNFISAKIQETLGS